MTGTDHRTSDEICQLIKGLPKAELHLHIEGTLEPELMFEMARRNQVPLRYKSVEEVRSAYKFTDLQSFLNIYYESCKVLIHERDFYELTSAYLQRVAAENVRHVEMFFDPQTHTDRGIDFATVINGMERAINDARRASGIDSHLILCFLRNLSAESAMKTLKEALPFKSKIVAIGLDSGEAGNPPEKFKEVFDLARVNGFLTVAHAGEEGPPEYIWQALNLLHVSRVDHGVRCTEDPKLVDHLGDKRIPLTMCPLSNLKLCVVKSLESHPLKQLLQRGLCVTINSDDPAYFGGYINDNYRACQQAFAFTAEEIKRLAKNSFEASFLADAEKKKWMKEVDQFLAQKVELL